MRNLRADARWRIAPEDPANMAALQKRLLMVAQAHVADGKPAVHRISGGRQRLQFIKR